jgi:hypothetical protein
MSAFRAPGYGHISEHTTDRSTRIWCRAPDDEDTRSNLNANRRTVGVIAVTEEDVTNSIFCSTT